MSYGGGKLFLDKTAGGEDAAYLNAVSKVVTSSQPLNMIRGDFLDPKQPFLTRTIAVCEKIDNK